MQTPDRALVRRSTLTRTGRDDHGLRARARSGDLVPVAPATYALARDWDEADERQRHALRVHAVVGRLASDVVVSHESALALHGFPLIGGWPDRVHVIDRGRGRTLTSRTLVRHSAPLDEAEVDAQGGAVGYVGGPLRGRPGGPHALGRAVPIVVPVRAALDVVRRREFRCGVAVLDHGLRTGGFDRDRARASLAARRSSPGSRAARVALDFADPLSESAGESLSRAGMFEGHLARPVLQKVFYDRRGFIGRVDFWWPCCGVVGEFDGFVKYLGRAERRGRTPEQVLVDEKLREDRLRALPEVRGFARWVWLEALQRQPMLDTLRAAGLGACTHAGV